MTTLEDRLKEIEAHHAACACGEGCLEAVRFARKEREKRVRSTLGSCASSIKTRIVLIRMTSAQSSQVPARNIWTMPAPRSRRRKASDVRRSL